MRNMVEILKSFSGSLYIERDRDIAGSGVFKKSSGTIEEEE
jgi:hypothetical protein